MDCVTRFFKKIPLQKTRNLRRSRGLELFHMLDDIIVGALFLAEGCAILFAQNGLAGQNLGQATQHYFGQDFFQM